MPILHNTMTVNLTVVAVAMSMPVRVLIPHPLKNPGPNLGPIMVQLHLAHQLVHGLAITRHVRAEPAPRIMDSHLGRGAIFLGMALERQDAIIIR